MEVHEHDQWIKQARGVVTPAVLSITTVPREHVEPTKHIKTALSHSNGSSYSVFRHIIFQLASTNNVEAFPSSLGAHRLAPQFDSPCRYIFDCTFTKHGHSSGRLQSVLWRRQANTVAAPCTCGPFSTELHTVEQHQPICAFTLSTCSCLHPRMCLFTPAYSTLTLLHVQQHHMRLGRSEPESALKLDQFCVHTNTCSLR